MEKCKTLINKLQEQVANGADVAAMMITTQLLQVELAKLIKSEAAEMSSSSVSVVLPRLHTISVVNSTGVLVASEALPSASEAQDAALMTVEELNTEEPSIASVAPVAAPPLAVQEKTLEMSAEVSTVTHIPSIQEQEREEPKKEDVWHLEPDIVKIDDESAEAIPADMIFPVAPISGEKEVWILDPVLETPTLAHQDEIKELNEMMGKISTESLNDRLKNVRADISSALKEAPVRDLKKAIGVNDRFLYLNELFRGDVDMYERSIKTINNFRILPEAEYWIERELKIKLGWDVNSAAVAQFNQLVKRRFAST